MTKRIEITLIHGTFAPNASWTDPTSRFCKSITNGLDVDVTFQRLQWSGRNSITDRIVAADALAIDLRKRQIADPDRSQIVLGHSHGGSVLAHLLIRHPELASKIHGIFLATPFIDARPRHNWLFAVMVYLAALFSMVIFATGIATDLILIKYSPSHRPVVLIGMTWLVCSLALVIFASFKIPRFLLRAKPRAIAREVSTCRLPKEGSYLFVRATGDEAGTALATAQFASWLMSRCVSILLQMLPWSWSVKALFGLLPRSFPAQRTKDDRQLEVQWGSFLFILLFVTPALAMSNPFFFTPAWLDISNGQAPSSYWTSFVHFLVFTRDVGGWPYLIFVVGFYCGFLTTLAYLTLMTLFFSFAWISYWSFGRISFWAAMCIELAVEPFPLGTHALVHTSWTGVFSGLSHSSTYENRQAVIAVRDWIEKIVDGSGIEMELGPERVDCRQPLDHD